MRRRWKLPFPVVSDPAGAQWLVPLDAWNPDERGGIAWPVMALCDPEGHEVFRFRSRDFADRPPTDDFIRILSDLDLPPIALGPAAALTEPVEEPDAFSVDTFRPFFGGFRMAGIVLSRRIRDEGSATEAQATSSMAAGFLDAWKERKSAEPS
jgi:hypothetical protein